tara:strand:+ start:2764 stop:3426 length:663 start_codon:yes stop_codon:yes gene_type:complete
MYAKHYVFGISVGQGAEPTAIATIMQESHHSESGWKSVVTKLQLGHLERMSTDTGYPELVARVRELTQILDGKEQSGRSDILVDITGAGSAIINELQAHDMECIPVLVTGGAGATRDDDGTWHLAKTEMVGVLQMALQKETLIISSELELASSLQEELQNFKMRTAVRKPEDGEVWRENDFDDLVFAAGIAVWRATNNIPNPNFHRPIEYPADHISNRIL